MINLICRQASKLPKTYRTDVNIFQAPLTLTVSSAFKMSRNTIIIKAYSTKSASGIITENHQAAFDDEQVKTQEEAMTEKEKQWTISEEDARPPKVLKPFFFFLAVGTTSFLVAAYLNNKRNEKLSQIIEANPVLLEDLSTIVPSFGDKEALDNLQASYNSVNLGNPIALWDNLNEVQLRSVKTKIDFMNSSQYNLFDKLTDKVFLQLGVPGLGNLCTLTTSFIRGMVIGFPDEMRVGLPIICSAAAMLLVVKSSTKGKLGKNTYDFLRTHIMHTPAANRLHTLTTSAFTHKRTFDLIKYSPVFLLIGSTTLLDPKCVEDKGISHIPETTTLYHFLAFCITAGTFANVFTNVFTRILLQITKIKFGPQIATKLIGRLPEIGLGGIAYGLMATSTSRIGTINEPKLRGDQHKPMICFGFISFEAIMVSLSLLDRRFAYGTERITRLGGALFGFFYVKFGIKCWEIAKRHFIETDQQALEIINNNSNGV